MNLSFQNRRRASKTVPLSRDFFAGMPSNLTYHSAMAYKNASLERVGLASDLSGQETARKLLARGESAVNLASTQISAQQSRRQANEIAQVQADPMRTGQEMPYRCRGSD